MLELIIDLQILKSSYMYMRTLEALMLLKDLVYFLIKMILIALLTKKPQKFKFS